MGQLLLLLSAVVATVVTNSLAQTVGGGGTGDYVPSHIYKEPKSCVLAVQHINVTNEDGCLNELPGFGCEGACTSYEFPVVFKTREAALKATQLVNGNSVNNVKRHCQCCEAVYVPGREEKKLRIGNFPLFCPDGTTVYTSFTLRIPHDCSCELCKK